MSTCYTPGAGLVFVDTTVNRTNRTLHQINILVHEADHEKQISTMKSILECSKQCKGENTKEKQDNIKHPRGLYHKPFKEA